MLQRIQTLFLVIALIASGLMFFFPVAQYYDELSGNYKLFITGLKCMDPEPRVETTLLFAVPLVILTVASIILSLITVFLYKNRRLQLQLVAINLLATVVNVILIFLFYTGKIETLTSIKPVYRFGAFLPLIAIVFLVLANRYIRKDEELVKDANRLR